MAGSWHGDLLEVSLIYRPLWRRREAARGLKVVTSSVRGWISSQRGLLVDEYSMVMHEECSSLAKMSRSK